MTRAILRRTTRTLPIYRDQFLPERVSLVYATSDADTNKYLANAAIKYADYTGKGILTEIASGRIPMNERRVPGGRGIGYAGVRTITVERINDDKGSRRKGSDIIDYRLTFRTPQIG